MAQSVSADGLHLLLNGIEQLVMYPAMLFTVGVGHLIHELLLIQAVLGEVVMQIPQHGTHQLHRRLVLLGGL